MKSSPLCVIYKKKDNHVNDCLIDLSVVIN